MRELPKPTAVPMPASNLDQITAAAQLMLSIYNTSERDRAAWERIMHATVFAAAAYDQQGDRDWASGAMLRAFLTALADPASPDLDYLRATAKPTGAVASGPAAPGWRWWVGKSDQVFGANFETREEAVAEATRRGGGYICHAAKPANIVLANYFDAEEFLDHANECEEGDHGDPEGGDPTFDPSSEQQADLEASLRAAIDAWQARHGLVFRGFQFADSEPAEWIDAPEVQEGGDA